MNWTQSPPRSSAAPAWRAGRAHHRYSDRCVDPWGDGQRFTFVGVDAYIQDIIKGLIIVVAVVIDQYRNKRKLKR
jgi:hypothetical protein